MPYLPSRSLACVAFLFVSSGCIAAPECDSIETRKAVLQFVSGDGNNPLVTYAAKNSTAGKTSAAGESQNAKSERPLYQLSQKIVTTSTSKDKLTVKCSAGISAAVDDIKATKEVTFSVQQSSDGNISVSVDPFKFSGEKTGGHQQ
jgi:exosome complex RNA-binding protein Csl4